MPHRPARPGQIRTCRRCAAGVAALMGAAAILVSGCQKPLFPPNEPRTQFEVHDRLHNRYTPTEVPDAYGRMRPALRERLSRTR